MSRAQKATVPQPLEHAEQAALMEWAECSRGKYPAVRLLYAVPNGGFRSPKTAATLKAEGVKRGVPDIHLPVPVDPFHGLYVELKRRGYSGRALGGRSGDQVEWHKSLRNQGYAVCTCYGWDSAAEAIAAYLTARMVMPDDGDCAFWGK
jgi:hypothetical protein